MSSLVSRSVQHPSGCWQWNNFKFWTPLQENYSGHPCFLFSFFAVSLFLPSPPVPFLFFCLFPLRFFPWKQALSMQVCLGERCEPRPKTCLRAFWRPRKTGRNRICFGDIIISRFCCVKKITHHNFYTRGPPGIAGSVGSVVTPPLVVGWNGVRSPIAGLLFTGHKASKLVFQ